MKHCKIFRAFFLLKQKFVRSFIYLLLVTLTKLATRIDVTLLVRCELTNELRWGFTCEHAARGQFI